MTEKGKYRVCGALAGTVNGLFGGAAAFRSSFLLRSWAKLSDKTALATCVAVIFPFCLVSVLVYAFRGALPLGERSPTRCRGLQADGSAAGSSRTCRTHGSSAFSRCFLLYGAVRYLL